METKFEMPPLFKKIETGSVSSWSISVGTDENPGLLTTVSRWELTSYSRIVPKSVKENAMEVERDLAKITWDNKKKAGWSENLDAVMFGKSESQP